MYVTILFSRCANRCCMPPPLFSHPASKTRRPPFHNFNFISWYSLILPPLLPVDNIIFVCLSPSSKLHFECRVIIVCNENGELVKISPVHHFTEMVLHEIKFICIVMPISLWSSGWLDCRTCNHKVVGSNPQLTADFTMTRINIVV